MKTWWNGYNRGRQKQTVRKSLISWCEGHGKEKGKRVFYIYLCQVQGRAQSADEGRTRSNCLEESHRWGPAFPLTSINEREKMPSASQIGRTRNKIGLSNIIKMLHVEGNKTTFLKHICLRLVLFYFCVYSLECSLSHFARNTCNAKLSLASSFRHNGEQIYL